MSRYEKNINLIVGIAFYILMGIFAPLEMYLTNKDYFFFNGIDILEYTLIMGGVGIILLVFFLYFIYKRFYIVWKYIISVFMSLILLLYFQGNFWLVDYGMLDGTAIDWSKYKVEGIIDFFLWAGIIILFLIIAKQCDFKSVVKTYSIICICLMLIQISTLVTLIVNVGGINKKAEYKSTKLEEFSYSNDENLIVIMLDSFDGSVLSSILDSEDGAKYESMLEDFVFYPDTTGMYSYTALAVPYILTGNEYRNDCSYGEYLEKSYNDSVLINRLKEDDWSIGIYNITLLPQDDSLEYTENCKLIHSTVSSHRRLLKYYYKLLAFRYLPQQLKPLCWFYADEMESELISNKEGMDLFTESNFDFDNDGQVMDAKHVGGCFRFYTLFGAHQPYHITEEFESVEEETDVIRTSKGVLKMLDSYLCRLKEAGIYDNSNIVVLADHGIYTRHNPLLLIKYRDTRESMRTSDIKFSYSLLQEVLTGLAYGNNCDESEAIMAKTREDSRRFLSYSHSSGFGYDSYFEDIYECVIDGNAWDNDAISKTGVVYSR